jgi:hypothetical protein
MIYKERYGKTYHTVLNIKLAIMVALKALDVILNREIDMFTYVKGLCVLVRQKRDI